MKFCITIVLASMIQFLFAQTESDYKRQIDSLQLIKSKLEESIRIVKMEIDNKNLLLNESKNKAFANPLKLMLIKDAVLLDKGSVASGNKLSALKKGDEVLLLSYQNDFYVAKYKDFTGFIYYTYLSESKGINEFKSFWEKQNIAIKKAAELNRTSEIRDNEFNRLKDRFGADAADKIMRKEIWLGMTNSMATESIGSPEKVNKSTNAYGTREQWVYKDKYLYFENGLLVSFQN